MRWILGSQPDTHISTCIYKKQQHLCTYCTHKDPSHSYKNIINSDTHTHIQTAQGWFRKELQAPRSTSSTGKFSHMAKHKGPTSGNASSPLKPKPIRSLMQTCRAPLSFISPFNVRGLESDSVTHPKKKKGKGKRKNYRGFQIIHMFSSRANWIKGEWKWLTSVSEVKSTWS